jgi:hypothetical protein
MEMGVTTYLEARLSGVKSTGNRDEVDTGLEIETKTSQENPHIVHYHYSNHSHVPTLSPPLNRFKTIPTKVLFSKEVPSNSAA